MSKAATKWLPLFKKYLRNLRIQSKHAAEDPDGTGIELKLWTSQSMVLEQICEGLENGIHIFYILKSRQLGVTTITLAITLFWLALHPNTIGCLVSDSDKNANKNRETVRRYIESLSAFMGKSFGIQRDNRFGFTFSNGSRLDMLVAGKSKVNWGEGEGYILGHLTEIASFGKEEGLESFRHAMAPENPRSLYVFESTAHGPNHWKDMWEAARDDEFSSKCIFVGWWSHDLQRIKISDPKWKKFGVQPPSPEENDLITEVKNLYGYEVKMEQLAWYRWQQTMPNSGEGGMDQNQPWTEDQCFVQSGVSFFQNRLIAKRREEIIDANEVTQGGGVEEGGFGYKVYNFYLADDYHLCKAEAVDYALPQDQIKLRVWEKPHPEGVYVIGVDPAGGRSEDSNNHCLSQDTEILTRDGWKTHDQISMGDEAVCFDPVSEVYSYGAVSRVIKRNVSQNLCHFEGRGADILTTSEHRMVYRYRWGASEKPKLTGWKIDQAANVADLKRNYIHVPAGRAPVGKGIPGLSSDMCTVLGWILTDGHIKTDEQVTGGPRYGEKEVRPKIYVSQSLNSVKAGVNISDKMIKVFARLCPEITVSYRDRNDASGPTVVFYIGSKISDQFMQWLPGQICLKKNRRIPRNLLSETSPEQAEALFQGILDGDGSWHVPSERWSRVSPGEGVGLADDIQELAIKCGYSASKSIQTDPASGNSQWLIHLSERDHRRIKFTGLVPYEGTVWCVTVPTGAFVARRNGTIFVTGNCVSVWRCFADKIVQVAEWADSMPETRHCAWVTAYLAGQYQNCRINIDLTGGIGSAIMQAFEDLRSRMRSEHYQEEVRKLAMQEMEENARKREEAGLPAIGHNNGPKWDFEDFLPAANWYLYRRIDSPGPGYMYNTKLGTDLKFRIMNILRDSWVTNLLEIRSIPLLDEMSNVVQTRGDIGASAPGRQRDDRTFGMALANLTWVENIRGGMISQGLTWDGAKKKESGELSPLADKLNRRVFSILKAFDEASDLPPPRSFWENRGLG